MLSQAFKSSAMKSQYNNSTIAMVTPMATKCFLFIFGTFLNLQES